MPSGSKYPRPKLGAHTSNLAMDHWLGRSHLAASSGLGSSPTGGWNLESDTAEGAKSFTLGAAIMANVTGPAILAVGFKVSLGTVSGTEIFLK